MTKPLAIIDIIGSSGFVPIWRKCPNLNSNGKAHPPALVVDVAAYSAVTYRDQMVILWPNVILLFVLNDADGAGKLSEYP